MDDPRLTPAPPPDELWAPVHESSSLQLADWWPRVGAATIDFFVRVGLGLACAAAGATAFVAGQQTGEIGLGFGIVAGYLVSWFLYAPLMMARTGGQTVGHRVTNTRVVMADGSRMSGGRAFVREALVKSLLIEVVGALTFYVLTLVNYLFPLWDDNNETLHDKMCSTRVVAA